MRRAFLVLPGFFVHFLFGADVVAPGGDGAEQFKDFVPVEGAGQKRELGCAGAEAEDAADHLDGFTAFGELVGIGLGPDAKGVGLCFDGLVNLGERGFVALVDGEDHGVALGGELALVVYGAGEFVHDGLGFVAGGDGGECYCDACFAHLVFMDGS